MAFLKERVSYVWKERTNPKEYSVGTWSNRTGYASVKKHGTENDKTYLKEPTSRNKEKQDGAKRKRKAKENTKHPIRQEKRIQRQRAQQDEQQQEAVVAAPRTVAVAAPTVAVAAPRTVAVAAPRTVAAAAPTRGSNGREIGRCCVAGCAMTTMELVHRCHTCKGFIHKICVESFNNMSEDEGYCNQCIGNQYKIAILVIDF